MCQSAALHDGHGSGVCACHFPYAPVRLAGMSASGLVLAEEAVIQPSLDDLLEENEVEQRAEISGGSAQSQTHSARLRGAEAALDAVRRKYGNNIASFGV